MKSTDVCSLSMFLLAVWLVVPISVVAEQIPNAKIDSVGFQRDVIAAMQLRESRRVTEAEFAEMARAKDTVVLDARPGFRFAMLHVKGAKHLDFADFTVTNLAAVLPTKDTRILIYCNNNFESSEQAFVSKIAPAALNVSTFTALYSYGYRNMFELGPVIDPRKSKLEFEGSLAK